MRRPLYIPDEVKADIRGHLNSAIANAVDGYASAREDEDSMTGHLGAKLQLRRRIVSVPAQGEIPGQWAWSLDYYKFRGRGPRATEHFLGADGLFELRVTVSGSTEIKSLLFQAKMEKEAGRRLLEQSIRLSTWREAAFVLNFTESGFFAIPLDNVIRYGAERTALRQGLPLPSYLGTYFLDCVVGDNDLQYRAQTRQLIWHTMTGETVAVAFRAKRRMRIDIQAPRQDDELHGVYRTIDADDIHRYRMSATPGEVLADNGIEGVGDPRQARRAMILTYHPDRFPSLDAELNRIMNRRAQEINAAADMLRTKRTRG